MSPLSIGFVASVAREAAGELVEIAVGVGVLVVVAVVERKDLPANTTVARLFVPAGNLSGEHIFGNACPAEVRPVKRVGWKAVFRSAHGRHSPCRLVIIAQALGLVCRCEVIAGTELPTKCLADELVV